ncbi:uncharacterized protein LTR77_004327 [Saxophila tyrrhenica]|uniref:Ubiquitin-like domain-containing protein n=1 Tax=Saxophila tyrrhenica TaxID=1690608 RepID=A0AAV9PDF9_9PEZI|nr:hypothetical protein LTR77_004327 [Saxophila tyrrhenica]
MALPTSSQKLEHSLSKTAAVRRAFDTIFISRQTLHTDYVQQLTISFQRTLRVGESAKDKTLPGLGTLQVYSTKAHEGRFPKDADGEESYFIAMYQREAMWINFSSKEPFLVRILTDGRNVISGAPADERGKRYNLRSKEEKTHDHIVTGEQSWVGGITKAGGKVRQFVARPLNDSYVVNAPVTGEEVAAGHVLRFEITPSNVFPPSKHLEAGATALPDGVRPWTIYVPFMAGGSEPFLVLPSHTILDLKHMVHRRRGLPPISQRYMFQGKMLDDGLSLTETKLYHEATVQFIVRSAGGHLAFESDMSIPSGVCASESGEHDASIWEPDYGTAFNVHILDSVSFRAITGSLPPTTSITRKVYNAHEFPFPESQEGQEEVRDMGRFRKGCHVCGPWNVGSSGDENKSEETQDTEEETKETEKLEETEES